MNGSSACGLVLALAFLAAEGAEAEESSPLRAATFNIRYNNPGDGENAWPRRRDWVAEIVRDQRLDLLGVQEALPDQIADLEQRLPGYKWYGVGRDDGQRAGEHTPIFYREDRFDVLDSGAFWLSETPERPGSKSWDAAITRVVVWLKLKDRPSGTTFFAFNTHFDHRGEEARRESAKLLLRRIPEIAGPAPVLLTGDLNCTPSSPPYQLLAAAPPEPQAFRLHDSRAASESDPQGPTGTWNGFEKIAAGQRIDYLFTTPGVRVLAHRTLDETRQGRFPSDHLPVLVELQFAEKE